MSKNNPTPPSIARRSFVKQVAALGGGLMATTFLASKTRAAPGGKDTAASAGASARSGVLSSTAATVVETTSGRIQGYERDGIFAFKGVPYGASTAGAARFMPPGKPEPWSGVRPALQYGPGCLPSGGDSAHRDSDGKNAAAGDEDAFVIQRGANELVPREDCLRLNVWTPEINRPKKRPVMVFMHGGGFASGCGHDLAAYEGENLARNDVVVVTHNHRLNVFGYLNLAELGGERYAASGNAGMLDLVAVLQWVRDNIANFGGDPGNVTIFGQSGGGGKVLTLMAMPAAKGLFHRAAVQSGPYLKMISPDYSARLTAAVLANLGLGKAQLDRLHTISMDRLAGAAAEALKTMPDTNRSMLRRVRVFSINGWGPLVDGILLPHHPFDPVAPTISADVPLLTGTNYHEFVNGLDHPLAQSMTAEDLNRQAKEAFGVSGAAIVDAYRREYSQASPFDLYAAIAAATYRLPVTAQAERKAALGAAPAFQYLYAWKSPMLDGRAGSFHAAELPMVFDNAERCDHYTGRTPEALTLAKQMSAAWVSFARTGNPGHAGLPEWPKYSTGTRPTMVLNQQCEVRNAPEAEGLRLIEELRLVDQA